LTEETGAADAPTGIPNRYVHAAAAALILLFVVVGWWGRARGFETRQDDSSYMILAEALLDGRYDEAWLTASPPHVKYPPGYPAELAAWKTIVGDSNGRLVAMSMLAMAATLLLTYAAAFRLFGPWVAVLSLAALASNPMVLQFAGEVASEPAYMALTMLALVLPLKPRPGWWPVLVIGAAAALASINRAIGLALIAAVILYWLTQRRWSAAAITALAGGVPILAWILWSIQVPSTGDGAYIADAAAMYTETDADALRYIIGRALYYTTTGLLWALAFPAIPGTPAENAAGLLLVLAGLAAGLTAFVRKWRIAAAYVLFYGGILLLWFISERFLLPLLPLIVPWMLAGLAIIGRRVGRRLDVALPALVAGLLVVGGIMRSAPFLSNRAGCDVDGRYAVGSCLTTDQASFFEALAWVEANIPDDAVIFSAKPEPLHLFTRNRSVPVGSVLNGPPEEFGARLRAAGVEYVLAGSLQSVEPRSLARAIRDSCTEFDVAGAFPPRTYLFRVTDAPGDAGSACDAAEHYVVANRDRDFESDR
jgi:hypothetical protein